MKKMRSEEEGGGFRERIGNMTGSKNGNQTARKEERFRQQTGTCKVSKI